ncbi:hypothetical protein [uncultured Roseibium sp.]|uniref:hypothetical protein n=1 Tax=uncultured Roseibium sp. TaxID=1936171 RepID=UPI002630DACD|nr:hypothetical protein [uncultured Roseibium sp.]
MARWVLGKILAMLSVLGIPLSSAAAQNSKQFDTAASARAYLRANPDGPEANAAFLALVEFRLMRENPGLSRDDIIRTFNQGASASTTGRQAQLPGLY